MTHKTTHSRQKNRNCNWRLQQVRDYGASGLSKTEFCRQNGIKLSSFYNWFSKVKSESVQGIQPTAFIPLNLEPPSSEKKTFDIDVTCHDLTITIRSIETSADIIPWITALRGQTC